MLKTSNSTQGILRMVSEFSPAGIIGLGLTSSTILLEIFLGDRPDDFVDVLPGFKFKWSQTHDNKYIGVRIPVKETPQVNFTLESIQHQTDYPTLNLDKILLGPVSLKRLHFMSGELTPDQAVVVTDQHILLDFSIRGEHSTMSLYPPLESADSHHLQHIAKVEFRLEK